MGPADPEDVWGPLVGPGSRAGTAPEPGSDPRRAPVRRQFLTGGGTAQAEVAATATAAPAWAPEYIDRQAAAATVAEDPFQHYVPPALLPLDDVSLGIAENLEGTGWIEAGAQNPLGGYMDTGPLGIGSRELAHHRAAFAGLDLMAGPQKAEMSRVERNRIAVRLNRARRAFVLGVIVCLVAAVVGLVRSRGGAVAATEAAPRPAEGSATLLIQKDGSALTSVTLLVNQPGGGRVVFVPTGVGTEVPGVGKATLAAAAADPAIVVVTVANMLGIRIDNWIATDSTGLEQLFGAFGTLDVEVPVDLVAVRSAVRPGPDVDPTLTSRSFALHAGRNELAADASVAYLNAITADGELARLARQADVWKAFLARLHDEPTRATALLGANRLFSSDDPDMREAGAAVAGLAGAANVEFSVLPVTATARAEDGIETFKLDRATVDRTVATFPSGLVVPKARPRLGVAVGKGVSPHALARVLAGTVPAEYDLVLSSTSETAYDETLIVYNRESQRGAAEAFRERIGFGRVLKDPRDQDVMDVMVTLGADAEGGQAAPATEQEPAAGIEGPAKNGPG